jgi:hypothetical protein
MDVKDNVTKVEFKTGEVSLSANTVLKKAHDVYTSVIVIGWNVDGELDVRSTNNLNQKDCLYLSQLFAHKLLNGDYAPD